MLGARGLGKLGHWAIRQTRHVCRNPEEVGRDRAGLPVGNRAHRQVASWKGHQQFFIQPELAYGRPGLRVRDRAGVRRRKAGEQPITPGFS